MKVVYFYGEGDSADVIAALKSFTEKMSEPTVVVNNNGSGGKLPPDHPPSVGGPFKITEYKSWGHKVGPSGEGTNLDGIPEVKPAGKAGASPMSKQTDCSFCGRSTSGAGFLKRHQTHCKKNPDRIPHPKEGMPTPWLQTGRKKWLENSVEAETSTDSIGGTLDTEEVVLDQ